MVLNHEEPPCLGCGEGTKNPFYFGVRMCKKCLVKHIENNKEKYEAIFNIEVEDD